jgi:hypothetical protein
LILLNAYQACIPWREAALAAQLYPRYRRPTLTEGLPMTRLRYDFD